MDEASAQPIFPLASFNKLPKTIKLMLSYFCWASPEADGEKARFSKDYQNQGKFYDTY
jgi:hypothetical protein